MYDPLGNVATGNELFQAMFPACNYASDPAPHPSQFSKQWDRLDYEATVYDMFVPVWVEVVNKPGIVYRLERLGQLLRAEGIDEEASVLEIQARDALVLACGLTPKHYTGVEASPGMVGLGRSRILSCESPNRVQYAMRERDLPWNYPNERADALSDAKREALGLAALDQFPRFLEPQDEAWTDDQRDAEAVEPGADLDEPNEQTGSLRAWSHVVSLFGGASSAWTVETLKLFAPGTRFFLMFNAGLRDCVQPVYPEFPRANGFPGYSLLRRFYTPEGLREIFRDFPGTRFQAFDYCLPYTYPPNFLDRFSERLGTWCQPFLCRYLIASGIVPPGLNYSVVEDFAQLLGKGDQ